MKKITSLIMTTIVMFSMLFTTSCGIFEQPLQKMSFEYTLKNEEVEEGFALIEQLEKYINEKNNKKIIALYGQVGEKYAYIMHQYMVAEVNYYSDLEDSEAYDALVEAENASMSMMDEFNRVLKILYESDLEAKDTVFADWTESDLKWFMSYTEEVNELDKEQRELKREFIELDNSDPDEWSEATENIYVKFISSANKLAEIYDYNNYYDYAMMEIYKREYTKEQREEFRSYVKEKVVPYYVEIYEKYNEMKEQLTEEQKQILNSLRNDVCEPSNEYLVGYIESYPTKMKEIMNYLFEREAVVYTDSENAYGTAYTNYSDYYMQPYVYLGNGYQNLSTVVHEMGHYVSHYHFSIATLPYDTAEVHSQGNEWLMLKYLEGKLDKDVYEVYLLWRLLYGLDGIVLCTLTDEYEELIYNYKENIDSDVLENIFLEVEEEYKELEIIINKENLYDYVQNVTMASPVYYLSYATSEIAAMSFYTVATEEGYSVAQDIYIDLCLETPVDKNFFDTLTDVGLPDPFDEDTFERIMDSFE